jgi:hypothetical protein
MRRAYLLILLALAALGVLAAFLVEGQEPPGGERVVAEVAPTAPQTAAEIPAPPPTDDPEALAGWFRDQVMRHLEDGEAAARPGSARQLAVADDGAPRPIRIAAAQGVRPAGAALVGSDSSERVERDIDWVYLRDVFEGRISGIPNETKAGLTLQEMDELGEIPYVEQLRSEERYEELRDLGFENETTPWPVCLRTGTCRRDRASSPP